MSKELKPCPFCGSFDSISERADFGSDYRFCNNCAARGPIVDAENAYEKEDGDVVMEARTAAAWNQRSEPASARRDAEPYIIKIGPDHGVCAGGRWDSWLFHKHADGHWVSQQKLASESLSSALAAPACLHLTAEMAAACRTCNPHQMPAPAVTREDARIPDHAAWAARGRWREAYEALSALADEART